MKQHCKGAHQKHPVTHGEKKGKQLSESLVFFKCVLVEKASPPLISPDPQRPLTSYILRPNWTGKPREKKKTNKTKHPELQE